MMMHITVTGAVQGIGYRPFVAALANEYGIAGSVKNAGGIVEIDASGEPSALRLFLRDLKERAPFGAMVLEVRVKERSGRGEMAPCTQRFVIEESVPSDMEDALADSEESVPAGMEEGVPSDGRKASGALSVSLPVFLPDLGLCPACEREMLSPSDRRFRYPLISCVSCGPRYSILQQFPYDRERTTMGRYPMCPACAAEYLGQAADTGRGLSGRPACAAEYLEQAADTGSGLSGRPACAAECAKINPSGRRRHAQTISCHDCGPQMFLLRQGEDAENGSRGEAAVQEAVRVLKQGGVLALKGTGGYQLLCDAASPGAVNRVRERKGREKKPFAVMVRNLEAAERLAPLSPEEKTLLCSPARPIVLVQRARGAAPEGICDAVCGDSRYLGLMLPSVGIHCLLCAEVPALVVTSANSTGEPIPFEDARFLSGAHPVRADAVLGHSREILRPLDDSVVYVQGGTTRFIRRSRGYVPLPVFLKTQQESAGVILAAGGDLKSSFAVRKGERVILSQYFGDLASYEILQNYMREEQAAERLFHAVPDRVVCDLHPGYHSSGFARQYADARGLPLLAVQHHHAHCASVMAEHGLEEGVGIIFDGTGYGTDGTLWGGEFLYCRKGEMQRCGSLSPVLLSGGDAVSLHASLAADGYRFAMGEKPLNPVTEAALQNHINTISSSSAGRLFDAVSSLLGIRQRNGYEGECAAALESAAAGALSSGCPEERARALLRVSPEDGRLLLDQTALVKLVMEELRGGRAKEDCALLFHTLLADASALAAAQIAKEHAVRNIVLSGGVFANRLLFGRLCAVLRGMRFAVYWNGQVPGNDGGIALGQAWLAGWMKED